MKFQVFVDPRALQDIQTAIDFYINIGQGLGAKFENTINNYFELLGENPFFQVRYENVRCLPVEKFPYMIHFTVDENLKTVFIHAVFHTSRNPKSWYKRIGK